MMKRNISLNVGDETSRLTTAITGITRNRRTKPIANNPVSRESLREGNYPSEDALTKNFKEFENILLENNITVLKPDNILGVNQVFVRDVGFVIGNYFVVANSPIENRREEYAGLTNLISNISEDHVLKMPQDAFIEGGDVILKDNKYIFIGLGKRTNKLGSEYLQQKFPTYEVIPLQLFTSDDPRTNILHLDCTFQPVGVEHAIIFDEGFPKFPEAIYDIYGEKNIIRISNDEMNKLAPNILSISPSKIISLDVLFEFNMKLSQLGYQVITVNFNDVIKLGGAFRCVTLPLTREF